MAHYSTTVEPRYSDLDGMNHVNHAVFVTYMEVARLEFFEEVLGMNLESPDMVVVSLQVDYQGPISWGDSVSVDLNLGDINEKSFTLSYEINTGTDTVATAESTQVTIKPETGAACTIPDQYTSVFESLQ
ncbi:acyl-CoA thioesterase [Natronomonas halophila]|uniref:acyl-CoA thioesterase n=1 Tax=Natronomonas halophila TaxID=2747817 RepID=UPI0015B75E06|nr:thioesterase family protein [Natronomonas halophila]QLD86137.1 acyl-CoA thioesterase [Natronomonas halophila]